MSYSTVAKKELCRIRPESSCCALAEAYGLLLYSRLLSEGHDTYATDTKAIADLMGETMASVCGGYADVIILARPGSKGCRYMVQIPNAEQKKLICVRFAGTSGGILEKECCVAAFLRGVFIVCGTVTDPSRDYHMEFLAGSERRCDMLADTLRRIGIYGHKLHRGDRWLLYIKGADDIINIMKKIGSVYSVQSIEQTKNVRDFRNNANRVFNCDQANIDRTLSASEQQCAAIRRLIRNGGYVGIPPELREIARLRLENPDMTLKELSESLSEPITRSGVNHRLKKLMELAAKTSSSEVKSKKI